MYSELFRYVSVLCVLLFFLLTRTSLSRNFQPYWIGVSYHFLIFLLENPFATPLEILPEWYFFPVFQILRTVPNKLLGVLLMGSVPAGLLTVPFLENVNQFQNPFRRPVATTVFLIGTAVALWLGIGAALPIDESLTLGLF